MIDPEAVKMGIPIAVAVIVSGIGVWGWFTTSKLNRDNEIFKQRLAERLKRRMAMFESLVEAMLPFINTKNGAVDLEVNILSNRLSKARIEVQLYGLDEEIAAFENFIQSLEKRNLDGVNAGMTKVASLIRANLRTELDYERQ
jgi:hypothetical protein